MLPFNQRASRRSPFTTRPHLIGLDPWRNAFRCSATRHLAEASRDAPMPVVSQTAVFALSTLLRLCRRVRALHLARLQHARAKCPGDTAQLDHPRPAETDGRLCNLVRLAATHSNSLNFPAIAHAASTAMRALVAARRPQIAEGSVRSGALCCASEIGLGRFAAVVENPDHPPPRTSPMYAPICRVD